ncbi:hypothetical protein HGI09_44460 [Streptomyces collinus]|uniref:SseB protein N-terminal domain-containing protein n=1 Tax=Streptomyces collinus (strain DSM 40733 / Tue 365) TaxID=1214242 RepID=S5VM17_STRC3|nr:hypothetical protein [Streptomyces collinus]AGS69420.1 hypothetical protein B446_13010 [Streptomyces collinus Tu 365]UJA08060.1 hypothetical protein HGI10_19650 [Streptomyces collinus]UJA17075.1 hypothetical protein HGI09_44460 [Streptomyces collinus]
MASAGPTGESGESEGRPRRSALSDIAEQTILRTGDEPSPDGGTASGTEPHHDSRGLAEANEAARLAAHRRRFRARLGEFRRNRVLVPYGENGAALTVELQGARWLLAFTDEAALARFARARGEADRTWRYRAVWGAAVLDAGVPAVAAEPGAEGGAGLPCGVLVDAGDGERGLVLPPVVGIVPDAYALNGPATATDTDADADGGTGEERR